MAGAASRIKVLHLINTLSAGGAELHLYTLCRGLKLQGVDVAVACLREHVRGSRSLRTDFERAGIPVTTLQADNRYSVGYVRRLLRLIRAGDPDVLHTHLPRADLAGAFVHSRLGCGRWVCSIHGMHRRWSGRWMLPVVYRAWRRADRVIAISDAVRSWVVLRARVRPEKVRRVYYGVDAGAFSAPSRLLRHEWGLDERFVIGSVGRLEPGKGHLTLIQAMPSILVRIPQAVLLIAGHDPTGYGRRLLAEVESLGLAERVKLVGFQPDVASFLHALDVFAFASLSEGFGQVLIEAMAASRCVVASKIAPLTEIVVQGQTGLLVRAADPTAFSNAIAWLHHQPALIDEMGRRGTERARSVFAAATMSEEMLAVYRSVNRQ